MPRIRQWLQSCPRQPRIFIEPFCGGGIVSLTVAAERLAHRVMMIELDEDVAAVWHVCLSGQASLLAQQILEFELTSRSVRDVIQQKSSSLEERAFKTVVRNRVNRGGILAPGAGLIKNGENGKGLASRWYPETLAKRIHNIVEFREYIDFVQGDGVATIEEHGQNEEAMFFVDPPYTAGGKKAGNRLYKHFELDHQRLFELMSTVTGDFLMSYDNSSKIRELASQYKFDTELVAMKNTHHAKMTELLVGRNLDWIR